MLDRRLGTVEHEHGVFAVDVVDGQVVAGTRRAVADQQRLATRPPRRAAVLQLLVGGSGAQLAVGRARGECQRAACPPWTAARGDRWRRMACRDHCTAVRGGNGASVPVVPLGAECLQDLVDREQRHAEPLRGGGGRDRGVVWDALAGQRLPRRRAEPQVACDRARTSATVASASSRRETASDTAAVEDPLRSLGEDRPDHLAAHRRQRGAGHGVQLVPLPHRERLTPARGRRRSRRRSNRIRGPGRGVSVGGAPSACRSRRRRVRPCRRDRGRRSPTPPSGTRRG